jgi:hypothetical protein
MQLKDSHGSLHLAAVAGVHLRSVCQPRGGSALQSICISEVCSFDVSFSYQVVSGPSRVLSARGVLRCGGSVDKGDAGVRLVLHGHITWRPAIRRRHCLRRATQEITKHYPLLQPPSPPLQLAPHKRENVHRQCTSRRSRWCHPSMGSHQAW